MNCKNCWHNPTCACSMHARRPTTTVVTSPVPFGSTSRERSSSRRRLAGSPIAPPGRTWTAPLAIGPETQVVIYDAQRQLSAARAWWLLSYLGVKNVGLLDGGYALWVKQGRPVSKEVPATIAAPLSGRFPAGPIGDA